MYAYIKGKLIDSSVTKAIVETGGIGYKILIGANTFTQLPPIGSETLLHVSYVIREFSQTLFGFLHANERELFEVLINVSGIGPKTALSMIAHLTFNELMTAISHKDLDVICKVPGIGKKTAERLVIELKDKLAVLLPCNPEDFTVKILHDPNSRAINDAMSAMINLGYTQVIAQKAIRKTVQESLEPLELSLLITRALKNV